MPTFALTFDSPAQAAEARLGLEAEGYRVDLQKQDDGATVVAATPEAPVQLEAGMARMQALADARGGELLGYGGISSLGLG